MFKSSPEISQEIETLSELLRAVPIGGMLTYQMAAAAVGRSVQGSGSFSMMRARKAVEKSSGARFGTINGKGIKRLPIEEIPGIGGAARRRIRNTVKKAYQRLGGFSNNDIPPEIERQLRIERSHLGAISMMTKDVARKKIDEAVTTASAEIPAAKILKMFQ
jgi:hypothetical protein